jgi:hypothetical protein
VRQDGANEPDRLLDVGIAVLLVGVDLDQAGGSRDRLIVVTQELLDGPARR